MSVPRLLTHSRVEETYRRVSAERGTTIGTVEVSGIMFRHTLKEKRVGMERLSVLEMLGELPLPFRTSLEPGGKGGWSVVRMVVDVHGTLWTGEMSTVEKLCVLGIAAGYGRWCEPDRSRWERKFPGGLPYYVVDLRRGALQ